MFSGVFWCGPSESEVANRPARPTSPCILCGICRVSGVAHLFVAQFVAQKGKFMDRLLWFLFWFLFETDEVVIEPLEALGADLTASDLEVDVWIAATFDGSPQQ